MQINQKLSEEKTVKNCWSFSLTHFLIFYYTHYTIILVPSISTNNLLNFHKIG